MTLIEDTERELTESRTVPASGGLDRPRRPSLETDRAVELGVSAAAAVVGVWTPFHLAGWDAPFGFVACWFAAFVAIYGVVVRQRHGALALKDRLATLLIASGTTVALLPLFLVLFFVIRRGLPVVLTGFPHFPFVRHDLRNFSPTDPVSKAGMQQAIVGSLEQVGLATLVTVPVGVLTATYLNEVGGRFAGLVRTIADAMTGLPSVIAGLFIYAAWVKPKQQSGFSGFAAGMALSVVMLPTVIRTAEEVLRIVSENLREAALALGAPEWRMVLRVVIPTARTGLVTAAILGVARAVGETAPVLLTAFGSPRLNTNPLQGAQDDLPMRIYLLVRSPSDSNVAAAWGGALLLVLVILTLFTLARILGSGAASNGRGRWSHSARSAVRRRRAGRQP
jgi:phosphate transport system permease protein